MQIHFKLTLMNSVVKFGNKFVWNQRPMQFERFAQRSLLVRSLALRS